MRRRALGAAFALACLPLLQGCAVPTAKNNEVDAALAVYADALRQMDYEAVANCFTENGETSHGDNPAVRGRTAIRTFLESFRDYKIQGYRLIGNATTVDGETARQTGTYWQRVTLPKGDTVEVSGRFEARWVYEKANEKAAGRWRLQRMATFSN